MLRCIINNISIRTFTFVLILLFPAAGYAGSNTLNLQKTAPFEKGLKVPDAVRDKCELETKVVEFVESFARDDFDAISMVESVSTNTQGRTLAMKITDLSGAGGGAWSGPKHLTLDGTLWRDGKIVGTFTANRVTGGGAWGGYKGTCSLLCRCAKTLGKDVAGWLKSPSMNARLGDAK